MKAKLTPLDILAEIVIASIDQGYTPSYRELADRLGIGAPGVKHHIDILADEGLIDREHGAARTVRLTELGRGAIRAEAAGKAELQRVVDGWT